VVDLDCEREQGCFTFFSAPPPPSFSQHVSQKRIFAKTQAPPTSEDCVLVFVSIARGVEGLGSLRVEWMRPVDPFPRRALAFPSLLRYVPLWNKKPKNFNQPEPRARRREALFLRTPPEQTRLPTTLASRSLFPLPLSFEYASRSGFLDFDGRHITPKILCCLPPHRMSTVV